MGVAWQLAGPRTGATNAEAAVGGVTITMKVTGHTSGAFKGDDNARTPGFSFTFQKIEQDDNIAKTVFLDEWESVA